MKETVAIMMTDIVGFTRMARQDEDNFTRICAKHKHIHRTNVARHKGRTIHIYGDKSLSVFKDPADAVKCSIEIQKFLNEEPVIPLRTAIHYGEVHMEGEDIFGNAVKIISHILKKAITNGILVSEQVNHYLESEPGIQTRSLGLCKFKHAEDPIEIFAISHRDLAMPEAFVQGQSEALGTLTIASKGKRLLAAIMFTDMVGYTALMQEDEQEAKQRRDRHRLILEEAIAGHQGKLLQYFGDGTLSIFNSSIEAIDCAIQIQSRLQETPKIPLRIGLHTGDIVYDDEGIYGDGVNVASRIEGMAVAGSVLISGKVYDDIKNQNSISTQRLGAFDLKNVKTSVDVYAITNEGLEIPDKADFKSKQKIKENSLAILPFASFSSDPENEFFSDGISEAIINVLAQLDGLFVTARTSSFAFKGQNKDIRELGKILGVVYILEGSVQIFRNKIRVTAQLIDTLSGFHIFSEAYDRELLDVFSIQDEIACLIAEKLKKKVKLEESRLFSSPRTKNMDALDFYARGIKLMNTGAHPNILKAMTMFQESIANDPDFVLPYTEICTCYTFLGAWGFIDEAESNSKSNAYALKALEKDPNHPRALVAHTQSSFWINNWDLKAYETGIKKAMEIAPGSADVRLMNGVYMLIEGKKEEALREILMAKELDPLNSNILTRLGYAYLCHNEFEKARDFFRGSHALAKLDLYFQFLIVWSYILEGQYDQAEYELSKVEDLKDGYQVKPGTQGFLHARQGRPDKAREQELIIKELIKERKIKFPNLNLTILYAGMDIDDDMFFHLERAFQEKPISLVFIQSDPFWEKYRSDKRYADLLKKAFHKDKA